jgi:hypothetical protein
MGIEGEAEEQGDGAVEPGEANEGQEGEVFETREEEERDKGCSETIAAEEDGGLWETGGEGHEHSS